MIEGWFDRLQEAIASSDKSYTELSRAAGRGQNYVQQMLKNKKQPGMDNLLGLLDALGSTHAIYVLTGIRLTPEALQFVEVFGSIPEHQQDHAIAVLEAFAQGSIDIPKPETSDPRRAR